MADSFLSEIRMMAFSFPPKGWAFCNGQVLPINQNQALFSLLGTTFGGDGRTNFALPNLQGRTPIHMGNGSVLGQAGGEQSHTLTTDEMPAHTHLANATGSPGNSVNPTGSLLGNSSPTEIYEAQQQLTALTPTSVSPVGGGQPHANMQPHLTISFCISLQGLFPPRN